MTTLAGRRVQVELDMDFDDGFVAYINGSPPEITSVMQESAIFKLIKQ